ncbi:hypothetical protein EVG20_g11442 [Dentipellis fragilis]|uniref:Uncharacterized protein n=1 Tax=Dentipellis fragilis TaxID=205917 RepID=A0A4Y9XLJ8_9AGAM|nr:hypothetical protein EVG20_g11442 [Dentipellis fragilis]
MHPSTSSNPSVEGIVMASPGAGTSILSHGTPPPNYRPILLVPSHDRDGDVYDTEALGHALEDALQEAFNISNTTQADYGKASEQTAHLDQDETAIPGDPLLHPSRRALLPFGRPDESQIKNLYELVCMALPAGPETYHGDDIRKSLTCKSGANFE